MYTSQNQNFFLEKGIVFNKLAKVNTPIKFTLHEKVKLTLQNYCLKCKQFEQELSKNELNMVKLLILNFTKILKHYSLVAIVVPNLMKVFWEEHQKYIQASCSSSVKYHPIIIRFCLNVAATLRYHSKSGGWT